MTTDGLGCHPMHPSEWSLANDVNFTSTLLITNMDVEKPWLPKEDDLQTVSLA